MSVPDEYSTYCEDCSSYNLVSALLIDGKYYCISCLENRGLKKLFDKLGKCVKQEKSE